VVLNRGAGHTASDYFQRCIALCHKHGCGRIEVANLCMLGLTRYYLGDLRGALEHILAGVEAAARVNHHRAELVSLLCAYYPAMESGEWSLIEEKLARASVLVERLGARRFEPDCLNFLARCRAAQGRRAEALEILKKAATIVRETGNTYCGARVLGYLALMTDDPREREQVIEEGKAILRSGAAAHNYFWFYRDVIEVALKLEEWDTGESYAQALEDFTRPEPLPWTDFFIARGRALAAWGQGRREPELAAELRRLKADAEGRGLTTAMRAIDEALKAT